MAITVTTRELTTIARGRYTAEVRVHSTGAYGGSVYFDDQWLSHFGADSYEEALLEAGGTIRYHVAERLRQGLI